jgi:hypothetical protein
VGTGNHGDKWRVVDGLVTVVGRIHIPAASPLVQVAVGTAHAVGHEGMEKILHRLQSDFHIPCAHAAMREIVHACMTCQRNKTEQPHPAGLLQPLNVPRTVWADIAMDFVEGLPRVHGKSVFLTVIDRFSKSAHFLPFGHPYTATTVARAFFDDIVRLHGIPSSIISGCDSLFTSQFWRELFAMAGVQLNLSSTFHPQTDGQSEAANKIIIMYLRCLVGDHPRDWLKWLSWAECCYNTAFQSSLRTSPFRVLYGRDPPSLRSYTLGEARLPAVQQQLLERDEFLLEVRDRLEQAQSYHKAAYDKKHRDVEFMVGQWVWVKLLHRPLAYRLQLPARAKLHDVFHVGMLKRYRGDPPATPVPLPPIRHGRACLEPEMVFKSRLVRERHELLVQWKGQAAADASWMALDEFRSLFPAFQLEDELIVQGGRDVKWGLKYVRRGKKQGRQPAAAN